MATFQVCGPVGRRWKSLLSVVFNGAYNKDASFLVMSQRSLSFSKPLCVGFARNLAVGKINMRWICPYPTLDSEDELEELNQLSETVSKFFLDKVDSNKMDCEAKFDPEVLEGLKELGLFGLQIPAEYGGLALSNVKYARALEEVSRDGAITVMLAAHQSIGLKGILLVGNEDQKKKYLPKLASGEHVAAFCLTEPSSGSDAASIRTKARLSEDGKHWILNGEKCWITNGGFADVMTVFAKTPMKNDKGEMVDKITGFIVERAFGGITSGNPEDKLGIRASNTTSVYFENTPVPVENVLGEVGSGFKLAMNILNGGRFSMGSSVAGELKRLLPVVCEHVHTRTQFGRRLSEFGLIKDKIFQTVMKIYAMESMAYLTAGQMDIVDDNGKPQDCSIEAAMVKIYSSEAAWTCGSELLQMFGGMGYMKEMPLERVLRDSRILSIFEGTNEILRLFVSLSMLQYAGAMMQEKLKTAKTGGFFEAARAWWDLAQEWSKANRSESFPAMPSFGFTSPPETKTWLHPGLRRMGLQLEGSASMFRKRIYHNLRYQGKKIQDRQDLLKIFADVAINLYAMAAVIARCNKAKILELRNCDHEVLIARAFMFQTFRENDIMMQSLLPPYRYSLVDERDAICKEIMEERRYLCSHPLEVVHRYMENPIYLEQLERVKSLKE